MNYKIIAEVFSFEKCKRVFVRCMVVSRAQCYLTFYKQLWIMDVKSFVTLGTGAHPVWYFEVII
jgi:hypothetical protein